MRHSFVLIGSFLISGALAAACSASGDDSVFGGGGNTSTNPTAGGNNAGGGDGGFALTSSGGSGGGTAPCDATTPDFDMDNWTVAEGDCNDCDANVNPGAVEAPTDMNATAVDENCDGNIDEALPTCDMGLAFDAISADDGARAMDLCDQATPGGKDFGVLQAAWTKADGTGLDPAQAPQFGIQADFGSNVQVQAGDRMLVLSSGFGRLPGQAGAATDESGSALGFSQSNTAPTGFPQNVMNCDGGTDIYDPVSLQVQLRAPSNATGFKYLFKFYSFEFAEFVCTTFNDQYIAWMNPAPMGSINGNISFDSNSNPVSVNIAFFDVCDPNQNNDFAAFCFSGCPAPPNPYCPSGPAELAGNGFDDAFGSQFEDAGATGWLETTAPIGGGEEFTIRFAIWDTGDNALDSTVLLDGFEWIATPGTQVGTKPPPPK